MARKPRVEFEGAFYHVIVRVNQRQEIFGSREESLVYAAREWGKMTTQSLGQRLRRDPSMISGLYRDYEESATRSEREALRVESRLRPDPALTELQQEHYSPEMRFFDAEVMVKGKRGVFYSADRELYISLESNSSVISPAEAPKNLKDLLDPKWKGKMGVLGSSVFARWLGAVLDLMGRDYVEQLSRQDLSIHRVSGAALATLMASGEVPLSPTMFDSNVFVVKRAGGPVEWRPIEPTVANVGYSGLVTKAPHTHTALLFLDYLHSKAGQQFVVKGGLSSPRDDVESLVPQKFKKTYLEAKYSLDEYEKKLQEWEDLIQKLFFKKK